MAEAEERLVEYLHQVEPQRNTRMAVQVHLSHLNPKTRSLQQMRIAAHTFEDLTKMVEGRLFTLSNDDLVFVFKRTSSDDVRSAIVRLQFMFADDPLIADSGTGDDAHFVTWFDLREDFSQFLSVAQQMAVEGKGREEAEEAGHHVRSEKPSHKPLSPALLGQIERSLNLADLSNLIRRQSVCAIVGQAAPQRLFSEIFVSIADLRETLAPDVDLLSSRWLFQHLTESLDRRILALLNKRDSLSFTGDLSININIATLLSPEFLKFDENIKASMRGSMVLELQPIDIFGDLSTYIFARDFARERGYRVCVDGLTTHTLGLIDRVRLGADMVKLIAGPELTTWAAENPDSAARRVLRHVGPSRIVLTRCDDIDQIEAGQKLGIQLFQGRGVEKLISEAEKRKEQDLVRKARGLDGGSRRR